MAQADDQGKKVRELLESFKTAMLVTHGSNFAHARPMVIAGVEPNCDLWFFTSRSSQKTSEIQDDARVLIVCQDERQKYVSLNGRAELVKDSAKAREMWRGEFKAWFPGGAEDPDLMLIRVEAREAEYWDNSGVRGLHYLFKAAKAVASGTRPAVDKDIHGKVLV